MVVYLCHEDPELLEHQAAVVDAMPGRVRLSRSALHPGGGGQESDLGWIDHPATGPVAIVGVEHDADGSTWHRLDDPTVVLGATDVRVRVDGARRAVLAELHTATHVLNALVFQRFAGALVTGAQISAGGTARMDFDLPGVDNELLRGLDAEINSVIDRALDVTTTYVAASEAATTPGLVRSAAVAPPPTGEGTLRVVDIAGLDRQACGGTHVSNTSQSRRVAVTKIENKGRHNRRVRLRLVEPGE